MKNRLSQKRFLNVKTLITLLIMFGMAGTGCYKYEDNSITLTVSPATFGFNYSGGMQTFTVTSNTIWTVSSNASSWLTMTPMLGGLTNNSKATTSTVTVFASPHTDSNPRTAIITVNGTNAMTQTINVTQEAVPAPPSLTVSHASLNFEASGEQKSVAVTSNIGWNVSISNNASWLTVTPTSGLNNGTVIITAAPNTGISARSAAITLSGTGVTAKTINVTQDESLVMLFVQGGAFTMGCSGNDCIYSELPDHQVQLSNFYIGKYEVTQAQWQEVMGNNPSCFTGENLPVEQVSWNDVKEFITQLNRMTGKQYRLPTEAEWEYAARGGQRSNGYLYSGSNTIGNVAWYWNNIPSRTSGTAGYGTQPVGTKSPNELGIYDMSGNVWEWCSDWYLENYYSISPLYNPQGPSSGSIRVIRGGCWGSGTNITRISFRGNFWLDNNYNNIVFRLACSDTQ